MARLNVGVNGKLFWHLYHNKREVLRFIRSLASK